MDLKGLVMRLGLRKLLVWLVSLTVVLGVYLLYGRIAETPPIDFDTAAEFADSGSDANVDELSSEVGMVGDVGIGKVKKARFTTINKHTSEIEREFGFEELLHKQGDEWEVEKPYMNVFQRDFTCSLTADRGRVVVETAVGRTSPKDATFVGNVVVHIVPENDRGIKESFVYLDDVVFISEKSQLSTAGPVRLVSDDARLLGTGMQLVYDSPRGRLEFLRIKDVKSLSATVGLLSPHRTSTYEATGTEGRLRTEPPARVPPDTAPGKAKRSPAPGEQVAAKKDGECYRCLFSGNVVIDTSEQLVFADEVCINDIFWPGRAATESGRPVRAKVPQDTTTETDTAPSGPAQTATDEHPVHSPSVSASAGPNQAAPKQHKERLEAPSPSQFLDVVVTCDNGLLVTPMDSSRTLANSAKLGADATVTDGNRPGDFAKTAGRTTLLAKRIDYSAATEHVLALGPTELTFEVNDPMGPEREGTAVPVKIVARKRARFLPTLNQVTFEGDCLCTMLRDNPNGQTKYTLSGQELTAKLSQDNTTRSPDLFAGVEHVTVTGGVVRLATLKMAAQKLLGGIELECARFDYDTPRREFLAAGPGMMTVDNSRIPQPDSKGAEFSLKKPSWTVLRDFETLRYSAKTSRIIADAGSHRMLIDYFPIIDGGYGRPVWATAAHVEADLAETPDGGLQLSALTAAGGITYEDGQKQFAGSTLSYDVNKSLVIIRGDESRPCLLNGALVDVIEYDLITGEVNAQIVAPGVLQTVK